MFLWRRLPLRGLLCATSSRRAIGYDQGYTTLELFFAPRTPWKDVWVPFLDLRGHLFDNGTNKAANAGIGLRYLDCPRERVWGVNAYYDFHNTKYQSYNQVALGFEWLGKVWDARLNGYLPFGNKKSGFFNTQFGQFSGNLMLLSREYEFSLKGANAEVGFHMDHFEHVPLYFAAGPYYLNGRGRAAFGGEVRALINLFDTVLLEGNASYDHIFKWIGQGSIGLTFALGRKESRCCSCTASSSQILTKRTAQKVDRFEIIPIKDPSKLTPAINPATGQPYIFWFVDNTSANTQGTFEAPFNTLVAGESASSEKQNIYIFPGDSTTTGLTGTIVLKDDQLFLGASIPQTVITTLGSIVIPSMASSMPNVGATIQPANNNTISGAYFTSSGRISVIDSIGTLNVDRNFFDISSNSGVRIAASIEVDVLNSSNNVYANSVTPTAYGIFNLGNVAFLNSAGDVFTDFSTNGLYNIGHIGVLNCSKASFSHFENSFCIGNNNATIDVLNLSNSIFVDLNAGSAGIFNFANAAVIRDLRISNCAFSDIDDTCNGIVYHKAEASSSSIQINNNAFSGSSVTAGYGVDITVASGSLCLEFTENSATPANTPAPYVFSQTGGVFNRTNGSDETTNIGQISTSGTIGNSGSCSLPGG